MALGDTGGDLGAQISARLFRGRLGCPAENGRPECSVNFAPLCADGESNYPLQRSDICWRARLSGGFGQTLA